MAVDSNFISYLPHSREHLNHGGSSPVDALARKVDAAQKTTKVSGCNDGKHSDPFDE